MTSLAEAALECLIAADPITKVALTQQAVHAWQAGQLGPGTVPAPLWPGRPARPPLVRPRELPRRRLHHPEGHAALIHSLVHIEFNAINLAWDAVVRFPGLPPAYYHDWVQVAGEEAYHFSLLRQRLNELGYNYGDFAAHDGLWETALNSAADPLRRMALVPRLMEARGLDVTPGIATRLAAIGDEASVAILAIVLQDEIGHVAAGDRWFRYLCTQRDLLAEPTYRELLLEHWGDKVRGPFNREARLAAGFSAQELDNLATPHPI